MHGRPLTPEAYDASRWIVEPFRLYDCCLENDGAAALILVSAERAADMRQKPAYILGVAQGSEHRNGARAHNAPLYATSSFTSVAPHLYAMARVLPKDVDVVQSYENFTGGVLMSLVEHGFFKASEAEEFLTFENLTAPKGRLPLNTSGGNLAECYMHGLELQIEAVRPDSRDVDESGAGRPRVHGLLGPDGDTGQQRDLWIGGVLVMSSAYLPAGLPIPVPEADGLDAPYWEGTRRGELRIQRCQDCRAWQWGPEWMCHRCRSFRMSWEKIDGRGRIYSWERAWHPVHGGLKGHGPYIVVLVELPDYDNVRMIGNLLGDRTSR
jgi:uncharacterized OB-fold protein